MLALPHDVLTHSTGLDPVIKNSPDGRKSAPGAGGSMETLSNASQPVIRKHEYS